MSTGLDLDLFDGIEAEKVGVSRTPKLQPGSYVVELKKTEVHSSQNPRTKGLKYGHMTVKVLEAEPGSLTPAGVEAVISLSSASPAFLKDVKSAMLAAANVPSDKRETEAAKIGKKEAATFFSSDEKVQSTLKGKKLRVRLEAATSQAGNAFTKKFFAPV